MIEIIIKNEKQTKIDNCEMIESVEFDKEDDTEIEIVFQIVCLLYVFGFKILVLNLIDPFLATRVLLDSCLA